MQVNDHSKSCAIILAGGTGSRLYPTTLVSSKQLLNLYDKPVIYYPFSELINSGIKDFLIISNSNHIKFYKELFKDSSKLGLSIKYKVQKKPDGIAQAINLGINFVKKRDFYLMLGDNIFLGNNVSNQIRKMSFTKKSCCLISKKTNNPELFGIVEYYNNKIKKIVEKPKKFISNDAVLGLYFYKNHVITEINNLKKSNRGELEITDFNNIFCQKNQVDLIKIKNDIKWFDVGDFESFFKASKFIRSKQKSGNLIGCIEESCLRNNLINIKQLKKIESFSYNNSYGKYIRSIANNL